METTDKSLGALIERLSGGIKRNLTRPVYLQVAQESGDVSIKQIEFLTPRFKRA